jgi:hypothetical protein
MANGQISGPPAVDFYSMLSGLGDTLQANAAAKRKAAIDESRKAAFSDFTALDPSSPDYGKQAMTIAQRLGSAGDQEGAVKFLGLAQTASSKAADDSWRRQEADRAQRNADRSYGLQERAANRADEDKFGLKEVTDPNTGAKSFVKYNTRTGDVAPTGPQIGPSSPLNPFSEGGKFNSDQAKAAGFTDRMLQSEGILRGRSDAQPGLEGQGANFWSTQASKAQDTPIVGRFANYAIPEDRQKYDQAKRDFINAQLRRESGAAISASEFDSADKQYFPVPGDSPEVIKQKAQNRRAAVEAMGREGGGSYRPKSVYTADGRVVALPKVGELKDGYRFKGGDPGSPDSWVKVSQ